MNKTEAMKHALDAITQYLAESPDPSEEAVENLCDARAVLGKTLAQPEQEKQPAQKRPQNCGTGYCSCIECVMEPAQQGTGVVMEEAWKLALEALESLSMNDYSGYEISKHETYKIDNAITALREARAEQPAQQEPVAWLELLREARNNCKASIVEEGISASRKEYRIDLEARLTAALNTSPPAQQCWHRSRPQLKENT